VLDNLKQFEAKASFFCIGDNIYKHPTIMEKVIAEGHLIGNHTFNHLRGWKTENELYHQNF
jgi:peptidoglycan/xylan/chitin deacetylase (PgdA/CDA1 family)